MKLYIYALAIVCLGMILVCPVFAAWDIEWLHDPHWFSGWNAHRSIAWDPVNNEFVIAYGGDQLYIARGYKGDWEIEVVDDTLGRGWATSIFIEDDGTIHISYYDNGNGDLYYAVGNASSWNIELVQAAEISGWFNSIAVDSSGNPYIAYSQETGTGDTYLYAAHKNGSNWDHYLCDGANDCGDFNSIAIDSSGKVSIAYYCYFGIGNYSLKYTEFTGVNYSPVEVDTESGLGASLIFDSADVPHIAYRKVTDLYHAYNSGSGWTTEPVDATTTNVGTSNQIFINGTNLEILSYDSTGREVHLYNNDGGWSSKSIYYYNGSYLIELSGAFDNQGDLHALFQFEGFDYGGLYTLYPASYLAYPIDSYNRMGDGRVIAVAPNGIPHMAFIGQMDESQRGIMYLGYDGSQWIAQFLADVPAYNEVIDIAVHADGAPVVVYTSQSYGIGRAIKGATGWQIESIETPVDVDYGTKLAIDSAGNEHIIYKDTAGELNYAYYDSTTGWKTKIIGLGTIADQFDIAEQDGTLHVVYMSSDHHVLYYATMDAGVWNTLSVSGNFGLYIALAISPGDLPFIMYGDSGDQKVYLKYMPSFGTWSDFLVHQNAAHNQYGLAIDDNGTAHMSFYDTDTAEFYYSALDTTSFSHLDTLLLEYLNSSGGASSLALDSNDRPFIVFEYSVIGRLGLVYDLPDPEIYTINPNQGEQNATIEDVVITGNELFAVTEVSLVKGADEVTAVKINNPDFNTLTVDFNLNDAPLGIYDLTVRATNGEVTLLGVFEVIESTAEDDEDDYYDDDYWDDEENDHCPCYCGC